MAAQHFRCGFDQGVEGRGIQRFRILLVAPNFKLTRSSAADWIAAEYRKPR